MQRCSSEGSPWQGNPPYISARGSLDRDCIPPPHSRVQSPHSVHGNHTQSTGQCLKKHSWLCVCGPSQSLPLYWGMGFVQLRVLVCVPLPHVTLQSLNCVHSVQPPSTVEQNKQNQYRCRESQHYIIIHIGQLTVSVCAQTAHYCSVSLSLTGAVMRVAVSDLDHLSCAVKLCSIAADHTLSSPALTTATARRTALGPTAPRAPRVWRLTSRSVAVGEVQLVLNSQCKQRCSCDVFCR